MTVLWTSWITVAVCGLYFWTMVEVAKARKRHAVPAPSVLGPDGFLRALRVQSNTVEQLVLFLPALWLCAIWCSDHAAAVAGAVWVFGRILYARAYLQDAAKRGPGFIIALFATLALLLGAVLGLSGLLK